MGKLILLVPSDWLASPLLQGWSLRGRPELALPHCRFTQQVAAQLTPDVAIAVLVLPSDFGDTGYWPPLMLNGTVISICFADEPEQVLRTLSLDNRARLPVNLTAQNAFVYTDALAEWYRQCGTEWHPGDYQRSEFLRELAVMQGHWLYWGHGEADRLRGYQGIVVADLLSHRPVTPFQSTVWLSCNTLRAEPGGELSIGQHWYQSGATRVLFAALGEVKTRVNRLISQLMLDCLMRERHSCFYALVTALQAASRYDRELAEGLRQYRLLGNPMVCIDIWEQSG